MLDVTDHPNTPAADPEAFSVTGQGKAQTPDSLIQAADLPANITELCSAIAAILQNAGCSCLAQRFACWAETPQQMSASCSETECAAKLPTLELLARLSPLIKALADSGYCYYALRCVEIALTFEPTWDLNLAKAYLLVVLGETERAEGIYRQALHRMGALPECELERLSTLATSHHGEEDILELWISLKKNKFRSN